MELKDGRLLLRNLRKSIKLMDALESNVEKGNFAIKLINDVFL